MIKTSQDGCTLNKFDVNMLLTCVLVKESALKRFISTLKICINRETALPRPTWCPICFENVLKYRVLASISRGDFD